MRRPSRIQAMIWVLSLCLLGPPPPALAGRQASPNTDPRRKPRRVGDQKRPLNRQGEHRTQQDRRQAGVDQRRNEVLRDKFEAFQAVCLGRGLSKAKTRRLWNLVQKGKPHTDAATGYIAEHLFERTLRKVHRRLQKKSQQKAFLTGKRRRPPKAFVVGFEVLNLKGLNDKLAMVRADRVLGVFAQLVENRLAALGTPDAKVVLHPFRKGGAEFKVIIECPTGLDPSLVTRAMDDAAAVARAYAHEGLTTDLTPNDLTPKHLHLGNLPHPGSPEEHTTRGTGIVSAVTALKPDEPFADALSRNDKHLQEKLPKALSTERKQRKRAKKDRGRTQTSQRELAEAERSAESSLPYDERVSILRQAEAALAARHEAMAERDTSDTPRDGFQSVSGWMRQFERFQYRAAEAGLDGPTSWSLFQLAGGDARDPTFKTGPASDEAGMIRRAREFLASPEHQDVQAAVAVKFDIRNLGQLDAELGRTKADKLLVQINDIIHRELDATEHERREVKLNASFEHLKPSPVKDRADVKFGDELTIVLLGSALQTESVSAAMGKAQQEIAALVDRTVVRNIRGKEIRVSDIAHSKKGKPPGTGIYFHVQAIDAEEDVVTQQEKLSHGLENAKKTQAPSPQSQAPQS